MPGRNNTGHLKADNSANYVGAKFIGIWALTGASSGPGERVHPISPRVFHHRLFPSGSAFSVGLKHGAINRQGRGNVH